MKVSSLALALIAGTAFAVSALAAETGPIKIGFMAPYVGVYTKLGTDMDKGFKMYLEEAGYKAGGRKIEVVTEDTEGKPELGPTKARKLIENDNVQLIAGIVHSGVALSIRDMVTDKKIPLIITNAGAPELTGAKKSPYIFRVSFSNGQHDLAGGWYAYNKMGWKKVVVIAPDYSAGHDKANGFMKYFKEAGGQVVEEIYPPLTTNDFGPYLTKIAEKSKEIDGVWAFFAGSGSIKLVNQYAEYGLKDSVPFFAVGDTLDDAFLPSMKQAAVGLKNYSHYSDMFKSPENDKFTAAYEAKYKERPSMFSEQGYVGAMAIVKVLDQIGGEIENREKFLSAMKKLKMTAPRGPFVYDENQNVVFDLYVRQVEFKDGRYFNAVGDKIPGVDQNWNPSKMGK